MFGPLDDSDASAAAAKAGLDDERVSDLLCDCGQVFLVTHRLGAGHCRHVHGMRQPPSGGLVAKGVELVGRRADKQNVRRLAGAREAHALCEESVSGVDGVGAALLRHCDDLIDVEVRAYRLAPLRRTDQIRLVGLEAVRRKPVLVAVDRHRSQPQLRRGSKTADRDLRPVRDEKLLHQETEPGRAALTLSVAPAIGAAGKTLERRACTRSDNDNHI